MGHDRSPPYKAHPTQKNEPICPAFRFSIPWLSTDLLASLISAKTASAVLSVEHGQTHYPARMPRMKLPFSNDLPRSLFCATFVSAFVVTSFADVSFVFAEPNLRTGDADFQSLDGKISITSEFPGGRMSKCEQIGDDSFAITIAPEADPINDSAWYAFKVQSEESRDIKIHLHYVGGSHRYAPKISRDGENWETASELVRRESHTAENIELNVPVDSKPLYIAGQELLSTDEITHWANDLSALPHVKKSLIGSSVQGRAIEKLTITESDEPNYVFLIARQHPPEVTGALGMLHFVDTLAGPSTLAQTFRKRFAAVVIPTVNPDGVHHGHWRCNANGVDLNRDWSHFTQPETRAVREELLKCRRLGNNRLQLFLDFHSTYEDIFYIPAPNPRIAMSGFTREWFASIQQRFPNFDFLVDDNHNAHRSTSKAWVDHTLGVTAVTYEFGDETERETIREVANGAAEEMMRILLAQPQNRVLASEIRLVSEKPAEMSPATR